MIALISFLAILFLSMTVVRIATVMLRLTGLSQDIAQFQARSAFTTTGFTAQESEIIMNHPLRRKIIQNLMILGNVGFVSFISSLILTMMADNSELNLLLRIGILFGGSLVLLILTRLPLFDSIIGWIIRRAMKDEIKLYRNDYDSLLFVGGEYEVVKTLVKKDSWLADKSLGVLSLSDEGILVIGVQRVDGYFVGSPRGTSVLYPGDRVIFYGREDRLAKITEREAGLAGDREHEENVRKQRMLEGLEPNQKEPETVKKRRYQLGGRRNKSIGP